MSARKTWKISGLLITASAASLTAYGAALALPPPSTPPAAVEASRSVDRGYLLGVGDVIDIGIVGRKDFDSRVRVGEDGSILLPMAGSVHAADRTVAEIAANIRQSLIAGGFFADPVIRVEVGAVTSRYVTVLGAVGAPGLIALDRRYRLSEVMARAGGRSASGADCVLLTRAEGGAPEKIFLETLATEGPDPVVAPGDKIYVPPADWEAYYISGQVHSPGQFGMTRRLTLRKAIARAGGLTEIGSERKVEVMRAGKKAPRMSLDDEIQAGDVITVRERLF